MVKLTSVWRALVLISSLWIAGCITDVWTGVSIVYDRHNVYIKLNDLQLAGLTNHAIYQDKLFKRPDCKLELAISNGDVLMVGQVPTEALRLLATQRIEAVPNKRRFYNQLTVSQSQVNPVLDSWITTKIRSRIFADSNIDPHQFKIVTFNQVVYVMGHVIPAQANLVILIARKCNGVVRVVKLLQYYNLSDKPLEARKA